MLGKDCRSGWGKPRRVLPILAVVSWLAIDPLTPPASAQLKLFHRSQPAVAPPHPMQTLEQIGHAIDDIEDDILDDGVVVIKRPDVWGQARMTQYRRDFEQIFFETNENGFTQTLQAIVARSDLASLQSQTALSATLTPTTRDGRGRPNPILVNPDNVSAQTFALQQNLLSGLGQPAAAPPPASNLPAAQSSGFVNPPPTDLTLLRNLGSNFSLPGSVGDGANLRTGIGLEPTIVLDEHKRYLDAFNQIRRINLGDDVADSAGYGLYLIRLPVSIQPGDRTEDGHGAILTATIDHDFGPDYLQTTFRNLVVADLVDVLGPTIYELLRNRSDDYEEMRAKLDDLRVEQAEKIAERSRIVDVRSFELACLLADRLAEVTNDDAIVRNFLDYIVCQYKATGYIDPSGLALLQSYTSSPQLLREGGVSAITQLRDTFAKIARNRLLDLSGDPVEVSETLRTEVTELLVRLSVADEAVPEIVSRLVNADVEKIGPSGREAFTYAPNTRDNLSKDDLVQGATVDELLRSQATILNFVNSVDLSEIPVLTSSLSSLGARINDISTQSQDITARINQAASANLPASQLGTRTYYVAPSDINEIFLAPNLQAITDDTSRSLIPVNPRAVDVRSYIRQQTVAAYDILGGVPNIEEFIGEVSRLLQERELNEEGDLTSPLGQAFVHMVSLLPGDLGTLETGVVPEEPRIRILQALCWAVVVDSALLDRRLREEMVRYTGIDGFACPDLGATAFFFRMPPPDLIWPDHPYFLAQQVFTDYIRSRWPIITFALDPVTDQQNIADAFSRTRDLQLAVAFAFATGRINFQQLNRFRRQLQYEAATIDLNRTVTSFAYGDDTFGWRFSPRFQTPPEERTNFGVAANLLIRGGPGRDYQARNSKLEAGQRELTAIVVMPSFLERVRFDLTGNFWALHDPDEMKVPTARMLAHGKDVVALRHALSEAQSCGHYRPDDVRRLAVRVDQLEAMLPMQTEHVSVPYENTLGGFQLFTPGAASLAPQLVGFEGLDTFDTSKANDIFLFGKNFSIQETEVVVGGQSLQSRGLKVDFKTVDGKDASTTIDPLVQIISREVIRLMIPAAKVKESMIRKGDGKAPYVEVYLATPNGISNRLLIPVTETPTSTPPPRPLAPAVPVPGPKAAFALADDVLKVVGTWSPNADEEKPAVRNLAPYPEDVSIRIVPLGESDLSQALNATFVFPIADGKVAQVRVPDIKVPEGATYYTITHTQLDAFARDLFDKLANNAVLTDAYPDAPQTSRSVQVFIEGTDGYATTTNQLKVEFEFALQAQAITVE